jgi:hypothetical protein
MTGPILVAGSIGSRVVAELPDRGAAGRAHWEERLTPEAAAARTMRLCAELLGDGGGSPAAHLTITMDRSYKSCGA